MASYWVKDYSGRAWSVKLIRSFSNWKDWTVQKSNYCFPTFLPSLLLYLGSKRIHPLTYTHSFFMWACNSHVENCISSAKQLSGTWQHHRNPSSVHLACSWLFINTMQTVQCGCMWNRKKNKGPEQVNTSFIISFV